MEVNEVKKKLGRPKCKAKAKDAEWLFGERLSAEDKETLEGLRIMYRCEMYDTKIHGVNPTALPKVTNKMLLSKIVQDCSLFTYEAMPVTLEAYLREKGCLNAAELLGLPEGPEQ